MAVLIECFSVVVRKDRIGNAFRGGWDAFVKSVPNATLCWDDYLARVAFMSQDDADAFASELIAAGFSREGEHASIALVMQRTGILGEAPWLAYADAEVNEMRLSLCCLKGHDPGNLCAPAGWQYEGSPSENPNFLPVSAIGDRLKFLRHQDGVDVYLDLQTDKELYVGRPTISGDTAGALETQIRALIHSARSIDSKGPVKRPRFWQRAEPRYRELQKELLPEAQRLTRGPGRDIPCAHFALALILRLLGRRGDAEMALRRANTLQPGNPGILKDLVRCLGEQGKAREALSFAREAAKLDPTDVAQLGNLAACLAQCGEFGDATRVIDQALELDPDDQINQQTKRLIAERLR